MLTLQVSLNDEGISILDQSVNYKLFDYEIESQSQVDVGVGVRDIRAKGTTHVAINFLLKIILDFIYQNMVLLIYKGEENKDKELFINI